MQKLSLCLLFGLLAQSAAAVVGIDLGGRFLKVQPPPEHPTARALCVLPKILQRKRNPNP
jgi:hypothetical protein